MFSVHSALLHLLHLTVQTHNLSEATALLSLYLACPTSSCWVMEVAEEACIAILIASEHARLPTASFERQQLPGAC